MSEILRDTLPIPCKNARNGCEVVLFKEALEQHEEGCIFRNIYCAVYTCNEKPVFKDYIDHFKSEHDERSTDDEKSSENEGRDNPPKDSDAIEADFFLSDAECEEGRTVFQWPMSFKKFHYNFFEVGIIRKGIMKRSVRFLGSPSEAKYFEYESCLTSPDGCKVITVDQVVSLDEPPPKNPRFRILADLVESYKQDNEYLDYKIKIRNLKEEAKDDDEESGVSDVEGSDN